MHAAFVTGIFIRAFERQMTSVFFFKVNSATPRGFLLYYKVALDLRN